MNYNIKYTKFTQNGAALTDSDVINIIKGHNSDDYSQKIQHILDLDDENEGKIDYQNIINDQVNDDIGKIILTSFLDNYHMVTTQDICDIVTAQLPPGKRLYDVPVDGDCGFACILLKLIFDKKLDLEQFKELSNNNLFPPHDTSLEDNTIIKFDNTASKYCDLSSNTRCFPQLLINSLRSILMPLEESNRRRYIDFEDIINFMQIFKYNGDITIYEKYNHGKSTYSYNYNDSSIQSFISYKESNHIDTQVFRNSINLLLIKPNEGEDNSGSHYVLIDDDIHQPLYDKLFPPLGNNSLCNAFRENMTFKDLCDEYGTINYQINELIRQCNE